MRTPFTLFNDATGFMEARNADGSWAGEDNGWTEGKSRVSKSDHVRDVNLQVINGLIRLMWSTISPSLSGDAGET